MFSKLVINKHVIDSPDYHHILIDYFHTETFTIDMLNSVDLRANIAVMKILVKLLIQDYLQIPRK